MDQMKYLKELAVRYPNVAAASTEIINLQAILHLPKGTEHYVSDVHGEYEKFSHIIRNGSGAIRSRIEDEFGNTLTTKQKKNLASVIYYPEQKMDLMEEELPKNFLLEWQHDTMDRLIRKLMVVSVHVFSGRTSTSLLTSITDWEEKFMHHQTVSTFRPEVRVYSLLLQQNIS